MKNRKQNGIVLVVLLVGISALVIFLVGLAEDRILHTDEKEAGDSYTYAENQGTLYYGGQYYEENENLETMLILGVDSIESESASYQADFLSLVVMDTENETFRVLHLNRDTMTEIPRDGSDSTYVAQLALAHVYGSNERARCRNTVEAVENLLYGVGIDHYISLTMDAIPILNDSVGGVTVELIDDFTDLDPTFTQGATVTLHGDQALSYVRARGGLEDSTNLHRMERQRQYISALFDVYSNLDTENTAETLLEVNEYLSSDCTIDQLSRLLEKMGSYQYDGISDLPGESIEGEYMEYYIDESAAQAMIVELFYVPQS